MRIAVASELDFAPTSQPKPRQKPQSTQALLPARACGLIAMCAGKGCQPSFCAARADSDGPSSINDRSLWLGFYIRRLAERIRLKLRMIRELVMRQDTNFVVTKTRFRQIRALLEHNDAKAGGRKFLGQDSASRAGADDRKVHFVGSLVVRLVDRHSFSSSFAIGCQPG